MYVCDRLSSILQIKPVMEILGDNKKKELFVIFTEFDQFLIKYQVLGLKKTCHYNNY